MTNELIGVLENASLEVNATITETGPKGDKGDDGYTPIKGVDYFDGDKGDKGDTGEQGIQGPKGDSGMFAFEVIDGDLILMYPDEDVAPNFQIDTNGNLIYTI